MEHNLDFGAEAQGSHTLAILRAHSQQGPLTSDTRFSPGVFLSTDPDSDTSCQIHSEPGMLLELTAKGRRPGKWLSLNIELGAMDLSQRSVFGVMCKSRSEDIQTLKICLRSGVEGGFQDVFFGKRMISYNEESTHADLLKLVDYPDVPAQAPWRELILFLPPELRQLKLTDLALFGV